MLALVSFFDNPIGLWNYIASILLINKGWGINAGIPANNPTWYIRILLICYIWYWIIDRLSKACKIPANAFYIIMIFIGINIRAKEWNVGLHCAEISRAYIAFFLGILLYQLIMNYRKIFRYLSAPC